MAATLVLVEIGERLRRQRKKMKMTQEETAECRLSELMSKEPILDGNRRTMVGNGGNARNYKGIPDFIRTESERY